MSDLKSFIIKWNKNWPFDYVWRKKYGIAFNSPEHKAMTPLDIRLDLLEEEMIQSQLEEIKQRDLREKRYKESKSWIKPLSEEENQFSKAMTEEEEQMFDNLNLDNL